VRLEVKDLGKPRHNLRVSALDVLHELLIGHRLAAMPPRDGDGAVLGFAKEPMQLLEALYAPLGHVLLEELRVKRNALEETRKVARTELDALAARSERVAGIERDAAAVLRDYAGLMPEALAALAPEDRHRVYKMMRLKVLVYPDGAGELRGVFGHGMSVGPLGITSGSSPRDTRRPESRGEPA
jgi:hypothetical protein